MNHTGKSKVYTKPVPRITREAARQMDELFPAIEIKPGLTNDQIMFNAGQRKVIDALIKLAGPEHFLNKP